MSRKSQKSQVSTETKLCHICQINPVEFPFDLCESKRCAQIYFAPQTKAFCQAEGITVRDLVRMSGGRFQKDTWNRYLNGKLGDALWEAVSDAFLDAMMNHYASARLTNEQVDQKLAWLG